MLKKQFLFGILITLFSFSTAGVVVADYAEDTSFDHPNAAVEQQTRTDARGTLTPANDMQKGQEVINPLFCTEELVRAAEQVAKNDCTQEDLTINMG